MEQLNFWDYLLDQNNIEIKQLSETERLDQSVQPLLEWFEVFARTMPWRSNPEPYWVWISEIMLQQTRVEAVRAYFDRFIAALPNIESLANIEDEKLMKLWEGLGYYSRARNLKKAAIVCVEQYHGELPRTYEELLKLPGIGSYTAGAIASIAYEQEVPAVDGNVLRVISRLLAWEEDITKQSVKRKMEAALLKLMKRVHPNPRTFTAALMELGALVCIPNGAPCCMECPWKSICLARIQKKVERIPVKKKKIVRKIEERTVFLIQDGDLTAIKKRPSTGLLAGLYELPNIEGFYSEQEVKRIWEEKLKLPLTVERLKDGKHIFSHIEWHMQAYRVIIPKILEQNKLLREQEGELFFVTQEELNTNYALPNAFKTWKK
ncbi:MAG TPA: A/G-specific adenine glycosylase [Candidatus Fimimorpha faecalis]|uniref:Adenine DNA glycosylase n=1 Tax=Candidatus Fimimorpha faecalis TaxID=2840824 RepID=A0A9D1JDC4_9FIRM|nr:A/G-specific adenine glycosylase [Candidatus Fimimorpha faecalis]